MWFLRNPVTLLLALAAAIIFYGCGGAAGLDPDRVVVAVLDNQTGDTSLDAVGRMASNWITVGLEIAGVVHVVPTPTALRASHFIQFEVDSGRVTDPVRALAEETGAGHVVFGLYDRENGRLSFRVQVANMNSGEQPGVLDPVIGDPASPQETIEVLRQRVMGFLAVSVDERLAQRAGVAHRPPTLEAYHSFDDGMTEYLTFNNAAALQLFLRASELDSTFLVPLVYAGISGLNLGRPAWVDSLAITLEDRGAELSEYDLQWVRYVRARAAGESEIALQAMRRAAAIAPGSKAVYNLAYSLEYTNRPEEALRTLETLDPDRGPMRGYFPYWARLSTALHMLGDHTRELAEVRRGRQRFPQAMELLEMETWALAALGRVNEVRELLQANDTLPPRGYWSYGTLTANVALELRAHGFTEAAFAVNEQAVGWFRERRRDTGSGYSIRYGLALALYRAELWSEAGALLDSLVTEFPHDDQFLGLFGLVLARWGDSEGARKVAGELARIQSVYSRSHRTRFRARIAAVLGDRELAVRLLREAIASGLPTNVWLRRDMDLESLRGYAPYEELMRVKG